MRELTYDELESVSGGATNYNSSKSNVYLFEPTTIAEANSGGMAIAMTTIIAPQMNIDTAIFNQTQ